jgi:hypothetical protein
MSFSAELTAIVLQSIEQVCVQVLKRWWPFWWLLLCSTIGLFISSLPTPIPHIIFPHDQVSRLSQLASTHQNTRQLLQNHSRRAAQSHLLLCKSKALPESSGDQSEACNIELVA